jgi:hypothetical protein
MIKRKLILFKSIQKSEFQKRSILAEVDWTGFEPMTPRVQGGYTTRLYYQPTLRMTSVRILIVVFLARILFEKKPVLLWYF